MPREVWQAFSALCTVWCAAVFIKAEIALRRGEPYTFSMWDGGALREGKKLSETGAKVKLVVAVLMAAGLVILAADAVPYRIAFPALVGTVAVGMVCDFTLTVDD